jgi:hypothetical protein
MLKDIITLIAQDTGMDVVQDRAALIQMSNRAAKDLYNKVERNFLRREITVLVPENKVVALPDFVGPLRGIAEATFDIMVPLQTRMQPRYTKSDRQYKFHNWRDLGYTPIHTSLDSIAPLTIEVVAAEATPVTLKIIGQTANSARIEEEIVLDAVTKETTNSFGPDIFAIACLDKNRVYDIIIKDDDGDEIARLANNAKECKYKLIDVSEYPWNLDSADGTLIDLCYKIPFVDLSNDADSYAFSDSAVHFNAMAIWLAPQTGKEASAGGYQQQALLELNSEKESDELSNERKFQFERNPYYGAVRRQHNMTTKVYGRI